MNFDKEIRAYLSEVRKDIINQISSKNFVASGTMRNRLRVVANQHFTGEVRGMFYMRFLDKGFTKKPKKVSAKFVDNIMDWMMFKGIQPKRDGQIVASTETNIKRAAFGIATGIVEKGTPSTNQKKNLDIKKAMKDNLTPFLRDIGVGFLKTFKDDLKIKPTK